MGWGDVLGRFRSCGGGMFGGEDGGEAKERVFLLAFLILILGFFGRAWVRREGRKTGMKGRKDGLVFERMTNRVKGEGRREELKRMGRGPKKGVQPYHPEAETWAGSASS